MENELKWNERFNIGVDVVDKAHQKLFSIVRKLMQLNEDEKNRQWACAEGIKYFKSYAIKHFAEEEKYMKSIDYSGYEMHKRLHDNMRDKTLPALEKDLMDSDYSPESIQHFLGICLGWLTGHIMVEDCAISGRTVNKWNKDKTGTEIQVLEDAVSDATNNLFKLQSRIVSEHYSCENFGNSIVYRLTYRSNEGKRVQIFLVLEEKLVIQTMCSLFNMQFKGIDKLVINATKLISQKWVKMISLHFELLEQYELEKDNLMTMEQLQQEFNSGYPYYSLLYDTGIGYFAFCIKMR